MSDSTPEQHAEIVREALCPNWPHPGIVGCSYCIHTEDARVSVAALARLAADTERLREALRDFEKHGLRCDLHPTMPLNNVEGLYLRFSEYLERQDASVRERARAALASPPADTDQP